MSVKIKNLLFLVYYLVVSFLMTFPGPFDWANRIEPWVFGLPFSIFYLIICIGLICGGIIVQYIVEDKMGELDIIVQEAKDPLGNEGGDEQ